VRSVQENCGLFGKVPHQGDFVCRHLAPEFTERWHAWLQDGLNVGREQLGDDWLKLYLNAPIWRFALSPGVCGELAVVGVLIPSVDEVGRYFPLTVAHRGRHRPWEAYLGGARWYDQAERLVLRALDEDTGYAELIDGLDALPPPQFPGWPAYRLQAPADGGKGAWAVPQPPVPAERLLPGLIAQSHERWPGGYSLWWTEGSERVEPCMLICAGLPDAGRVAAMLDGDWQRWNWAVQRPVEAGEAGDG